MPRFFSGFIRQGRRLLSRAGAGTFAALALSCLFVAPLSAWAQQAAPPSPSLRRAPAPWIGFAVIFVLLVLVLAVSILPAKRGHQD